MRIKIPLWQGAVNTSAIPVSSTNALAVTLTHNAGSPWVVEKFALSFNGATPAQAGALVQLSDSQRSRFFVQGQISLGAIGFPRSASGALAVAPILANPLKYPFVLQSGQSVQLVITTDASTSFVANDLCLYMYGYQWFEDASADGQL